MTTEFPSFSDKIAKNLKISSRSCYENGKELLCDANILYDRERYPRASSLAILAEEEFGKGMMLMICSENKRWDNGIYSSLTNHGRKQAMASGMLGFTNLFLNHIKHPSNLFIPMSLNIEKTIEGISKKVKKEYITKQKKDTRKQNAQFVSIDRMGVVSNSPQKITKSDAQNDLDFAFKACACLELIYNERSHEDPLLRSSDVCRGSNMNLIIEHHSGITVKMNPFSLYSKEESIGKTFIAPYILIKKFPSLQTKDLNEEQKHILANLYCQYNVPSQIKNEMKTLGLRSTEFLDEVEYLINHYTNEHHN